MKKNITASTLAIYVLISFAYTDSSHARPADMRNYLNEECGRVFDGVNAFYPAGLKRSLKIRLDSRPYKERSTEIRELRCRLRLLDKYH